MAKAKARQDNGLIRFPAVVTARLRDIESAKTAEIQEVAIKHARMQLEYIRGFCDATGIDISMTELVLLPDMTGARSRAHELPPPAGGMAAAGA